MENILAKKEKVDFCKKELENKVNQLWSELEGIGEDRSKYKQLYPFEYPKHIEINREILHHTIDDLIKHLKYMKEKIVHDDTFLDKR
jgi:hypothetical protein